LFVLAILGLGLVVVHLVAAGALPQPWIESKPATLSYLPGPGDSAPPKSGPQFNLMPIPPAAYQLGPRGEQPEVDARDSRGVRLLWPAQGWISTYFHEAGPWWVGGYHQGLDVAADWDAPINAAAGGTVVEAADSGWNRGYGNYILIDHGNGLRTLYAHLASLAVQVGDEVQREQFIGRVGASGAADGPHLHFEVRIDANQVDPLPYLP